MSGYGLFRIVTLTKCMSSNASTSLCRTNILNRTQTCGYAKKVDGRPPSAWFYLRFLPVKRKFFQEVAGGGIVGSLDKEHAAKGKAKGLVKDELKGPEVCKDPVRLTTYAVGVNIFKQGEDPQLKPPEQYPEWLFELNLGKPQKLQELDSDTWHYWKRLRKENIWRFNKLQKGKKF